MKVGEVIEEIKRLPPSEQAEVIRFAYNLDAQRQLTGKELSGLAERMTRYTDPAEKAMVREAIVRGFYGGARGEVVQAFSGDDSVWRGRTGKDISPAGAPS